MTDLIGFSMESPSISRDDTPYDDIGARNVSAGAQTR
jgi:hypothetical protein